MFLAVLFFFCSSPFSVSLSHTHTFMNTTWNTHCDFPACLNYPPLLPAHTFSCYFQSVIPYLQSWEIWGRVWVTSLLTRSSTILTRLQQVHDRKELRRKEAEENQDFRTFFFPHQFVVKIPWLLNLIVSIRSLTRYNTFSIYHLGWWQKLKAWMWNSLKSVRDYKTLWLMIEQRKQIFPQKVLKYI